MGRFRVTLLSLIAALLSFAGAGPANATVVYEYVGPNYTFAAPGFTTSMHMDIILTLTNPLLPGLTDFNLLTDSSFVSASLDTGLDTRSPTTVLLSTDAFGSIIGWTVDASTNEFPCLPLLRQSTSSGDLVQCRGVTSASVEHANVGWTGPPLNGAVPEPSSFVLLAVSLIVFGGRVYVRRGRRPRAAVHAGMVR